MPNGTAACPGFFRPPNQNTMRLSLTLLRPITWIPFIIVLASCHKEDDGAPLTELTLRHELTISIPPGNDTAHDIGTTFDARSALVRLLEEKGFSPEQLRDVRIEDARAVMIEPLNVPFTDITALQVGFTQTAGTPLPFAHLDPIPAHGTIIELLLEHADLTPFFRNDAQTVHVRLKTTGLADSGITRVRFALAFRVKAGD